MKLIPLDKHKKEQDKNYIENFISDLNDLLELYEIKRIYGFDDESITIENSENKSFSIIQVSENDILTPITN